MIQVEESRLAELLREEWKLQALEAGGVDNWEWYDESLFHPDLNDIENMSDREIIEKFRNA